MTVYTCITYCCIIFFISGTPPSTFWMKMFNSFNSIVSYVNSKGYIYIHFQFRHVVPKMANLVRKAYDVIFPRSNEFATNFLFAIFKKKKKKKQLCLIHPIRGVRNTSSSLHHSFKDPWIKSAKISTVCCWMNLDLTPGNLYLSYTIDLSSKGLILQKMTGLTC